MASFLWINNLHVSANAIISIYFSEILKNQQNQQYEKSKNKILKEIAYKQKDKNIHKSAIFLEYKQDKSVFGWVC